MGSKKTLKTQLDHTNTRTYIPIVFLKTFRFWVLPSSNYSVLSRLLLPLLTRSQKPIIESRSLPTEAELFVYLREDIQKLSKAVQGFVTQVNSNHVDVFDNPSDDEYDLDLSDYKEDEEFFF
ncbi:hypothetical protein YC2023_061081 [Brassica napus]